MRLFLQLLIKRYLNLIPKSPLLLNSVPDIYTQEVYHIPGMWIKKKCSQLNFLRKIVWHFTVRHSNPVVFDEIFEKRVNIDIKFHHLWGWVKIASTDRYFRNLVGILERINVAWLDYHKVFCSKTEFWTMIWVYHYVDRKHKYSYFYTLFGKNVTTKMLADPQCIMHL